MPCSLEITISLIIRYVQNWGSHLSIHHVTHVVLTGTWQAAVPMCCDQCCTDRYLRDCSTYVLWATLSWQMSGRLQYFSRAVSHVQLENVWQVIVPHALWAMLIWQTCHRSPYLMCCEPCWADKCQTDYSTSCVVSHVDLSLTNMRQITVPHVLWAMLIWVWQTCDRLQYYMCCEPCYDVPKVLRDMSSWQMSDRLQYLMCCEPCWADKHLTDYST